MTLAGRLAAGAVAAAAAGGLAVPVVATTAAAEPLGVGWEGEFTDARIVDGYEASGDRLAVPVHFEFRGSPGSEITSITLLLSPRGGGCSTWSQTQTLSSGDEVTPGTAPPTSSPPATQPEAVATADWTFRFDPGCNAVYDLEVFATADPGGAVEPGDPGTESQPLRARNIEVSLSAPSPADVSAAVAADRRVTVRWETPTAWLEDVPDDAYGYRVVRVGGDGAPVTIADDLSLDTRSWVDDGLVAAPAGTYRYQVHALRLDADGAPVASRGAEAAVELAATATPTSTAPAPGGGARGGVRVGGASARVGQPAVSPPTVGDPGFDPELDYSEHEFGEEEAVVPDDAHLFDIVTEGPTSSGLLVPSAVALCLAVWAGHLRHLARRATPPGG